jgi:predicted PurR-regulated permease PerM
MQTTTNKVQHYFFLILFVGVLIVIFFILRPFLSALVLALALSIAFKPVYNRIVRLIGGKGTLAALITVVLIILIVLIPLLVVGSILFHEVTNLYVDLTRQSGGEGIIGHFASVSEKALQNILPDVTIDVASYVQGGLQWAVTHLDTFFSGFLKVILSLFVMTIAIFYLLRDGGGLRKVYLSLSPLSDTHDEKILKRITQAINAVIRGSLIIAVVQGTLAAVGTTFAGLPNPIIWGILATIASLIPGLGTGLVIGPAIIYLFFVGNISQAVILLIWQSLVVGLIDNFLSPYLINRGMQIHPFLVLLSVLGGIGFFGPIGFILGPIILAFFFALLDIYPLIIK